MRVRLAPPSVALVAALAGSCATHAQPDYVATSIRSADCTAPPPEVAARYAARDLGVQQCPAPEGWRLLFVSSDASSWIEIAGPGITWSGERAIVYESPIGNFPNVDPSHAVEWHRDTRGRLRTVIFRVTAQDPATLQATRSVLYVLRLSDMRACVIGREATDERARAMVRDGADCPDRMAQP